MKPERPETAEETADRLRRYREAAELLRQWRSKPEDESLDWAAIEADLDADGNSRSERDAQFLVTVLKPPSSDEQRAAWLKLSAQGLAAAYGENEPDYSDIEIQPL